MNPGTTPALGETGELTAVGEPDPASASLVEVPEIHEGTAQGPLDALVLTPHRFDLAGAARGLVRWVFSLAGALGIFTLFTRRKARKRTARA